MEESHHACLCGKPMHPWCGQPMHDEAGAEIEGSGAGRICDDCSIKKANRPAQRYTTLFGDHNLQVQVEPWVMVVRQIQQVQVMKVPLREALALVLLAKAPQARHAQAALQLQSDLTSLTSVRGTQAQSVMMCLATSASAPSDQLDTRQTLGAIVTNAIAMKMHGLH